LLILADGAWGEKTVVEDREYLRAMLQPSQQLNLNYGLLWWVNANSRLVPGVPKDLVAVTFPFGTSNWNRAAGSARAES
jgi:hypothetical protein